jgi:hypothetical protein
MPAISPSNKSPSSGFKTTFGMAFELTNKINMANFSIFLKNQNVDIKIEILLSFVLIAFQMSFRIQIMEILPHVNV